MVKNVEKFLRSDEKERKRYLRSLTLKKSARIMEMLITSRIWEAMFHRRRDKPASVRYTLKYAK